MGDQSNIEVSLVAEVPAEAIEAPSEPPPAPQPEQLPPAPEPEMKQPPPPDIAPPADLNGRRLHRLRLSPNRRDRR